MENHAGNQASDRGGSDLDHEACELSGVAEVVYTGASCIEDVDPSLLSQFSAVMLRRCQFGPDQLALLPQLKSVIRMGVGYDNIDLVQPCCVRVLIMWVNRWPAGKQELWPVTVRMLGWRRLQIPPSACSSLLLGELST